MDLSLDEIIKKNNIGRNPRNSQNNRGRPRLAQQNSAGRKNNVIRGNNGKSLPINNGRVSKVPPRRQPGGNIVDARALIIKKTRMRLTDARDKLATIAKRTDARTKIVGRNSNRGQQANRRRPVRNEYTENTKSLPVVLQRSIKNNVNNRQHNFRGETDDLIRCTINQNVQYSHQQPASSLYVNDYVDDEDMSLPPPPTQANIKVVRRNDYRQYNPPTYVVNDPEPEPMFVDYEPYTRGQPIESLSSMSGDRMRMSQQMRARLDTAPPSYPPAVHSHPPPSSAQGYRIVVSNLHPRVTHEDIKELFGDIGPLMTWRLVRPGTAEVVYKQQKDARKAVEVYHNRQLDKQPMKCLLVNSRSAPAPAPSSGVLRSSNMTSLPKFPTSSKSNIVPDISAIHKALFTSK